MTTTRPLRIVTAPLVEAPLVEPSLFSWTATGAALTPQVVGQLALDLPEGPGIVPGPASDPTTYRSPLAVAHTRPDWVLAGCPSDPGAFTRAAAQAVLEIALGARPAAQAVRWCAPDVYAALARRGVVAARRRAAAGARIGSSTKRSSVTVARTGTQPQPAPVVRAVRTCVLGPTQVEASAVMLHHGRARAVALRLDSVRGRWVVGALVIG